MNYTFEEFEKNAAEIIAKTAQINPEFMANPAYAGFIANIIYNLHSSEYKLSPTDSENDFVNVKVEGNKIIVETEKKMGMDGYASKMVIEVSSPEKIECTVFRSERKEGNYQVITKMADRNTITYNPNSRGIPVQIETGRASIEAKDKYATEGTCFATFKVDKYNENGINVSSRIEFLPDHYQVSLPATIGGADGEFIIFSAKRRLEMLNQQKKVVQIDRDKFDTATYYSKDDKEQIKGTVSLDSEHGLREMRVFPGEIDNLKNPYAKILPMSEEQIEYLINKESNPKVREGLKALAVDRKNYIYDPLTDSEREYVSFESQGRGL